MSSPLEPHIIQLIYKGLSDLEQLFTHTERRHKFICSFPFDQLTSYTPHEEANLRMCVELLYFFMRYEEFFTFGLPYKHALDFVLTNLTLIKSNCQPIHLLLDFLKNLLSKNQVYHIDNNYNRTVETLLNLVSRITLEKPTFVVISDILRLALESDGLLVEDELLSKIFDVLNRFHQFPALWTITRYVLFKGKFHLGVFGNVQTWLLDADFLEFAQSIQDGLFDEMLLCLHVAFALNDSFRRSGSRELPSYGKLTKVASFLVEHCENMDRRARCLDLFTFLLVDFYRQSNMHLQKGPIREQFEQLPMSPEDWPAAQVDLFFSICHLQVLNDDLFWSEETVLEALNTAFYAAHNRDVQLHILKSIFYLYPILIRRRNSGESDDFLNYFLMFSTMSFLYSYNSHQLRWILSGQVARQQKMRSIVHWLNHSDDVDTLATVIGQCNAMDCLMQLVCDYDWNKSNVTKNKLCLVMNKVKNVEMSQNLMSLIPKAVGNLAFFSNLMLCEPGVPDNPSNGIMICTIMGAIIPQLNDMEVLSCACRYAYRVLGQLKNIPDSVNAFTRNVTNVKYLVQITPKVAEDTSVEIITLLQVIVGLQRRHRITSKQRFFENLDHFLTGSNLKLCKTIKLLSLITRYENAVIMLDRQTQLQVFNKVWELCDIAELQPLIYQFIEKALQKKTFLAPCLSTCVYIEMACFGYFGKGNSQSLAHVVEKWMRGVASSPENAFCPVPKEAVASFIRKACINENEKMSMLTTLKRLVDKEHRYRA